MRDNLAQEIAALPEVEAVIPVRFQRIDYQNKIVSMIAVDAANFEAVAPGRLPAARLEAMARLKEPGTVLVSEGFALLYGLGEGSSLHVPTPRGPWNSRLAGSAPRATASASCCRSPA